MKSDRTRQPHGVMQHGAAAEAYQQDLVAQDLAERFGSRTASKIRKAVRNVPADPVAVRAA